MFKDKIMRNFIAFTFISILLVFSSCRKDEISPLEPTFVPDEPTVEVESTFFGLVKNSDGEALSAVTVITEAGEIITDENGYFIVENSPLDQEGSLVKAVRRGYYDAYRFVMPSPGTSAYIEIIMTKKVSQGTVAASSTRTFDLADNTTLTLNANTIANEDGTAYSGDYEVFIHYYNPADAGFVEEFPGDLRGITALGEEVQLVSYGMMAVELVSSSGEPLNLLAGTTARWEIGVDPSLTDLPDEMPLWSLDENSGVWQEEGMATLVDGKYVGEPTHFSFWNCDYPYPMVELKGVVVGQNQFPLPRVNVHVKTKNGISGYAITDSEGRFRGKVPKDEELELSLYSSCGDSLFRDLGALSVDTDLEEIELTQSNLVSEFSGVFLDCSGAPVENGYVSITFESRLYSVVPIGENGEFSGILSACGQGQYAFKAVDADGLTESEELVFEYSDLESQMLLGEISACDNELDVFMRIKFEGETYLETDLFGTLSSGNLFTASEPNGGNKISVFLLSQDIFELSFFADDLGAECNDSSGCEDLTAVLTLIPSPTQDYCEGTISGTMNFMDGVSREVEIEFRLKVDSRTWNFGVNFWLDENANGIKDPEDLPVTDLEVLYNGVSLGTLPSGHFNLPAEENEEINVVAQLGTKYKMTLQDVGDDDDIDSDFNTDGTFILPGITERTWVDGGLVLTGIISDVRFEQLPKYCDDGSGCVTVSFPDDLQAEYEVEINDNFGSVLYESGPVTGYHQVCELEPDIYEVVIRVNGQRVWDKDIIIFEDSLTINKDVRINCVGGEVEATMSVILSDSDEVNFIYPFGPEWRNEQGMVVQTGPEYIAGPGTYTFTAVYQGCDKSVEFVIPEKLLGVGGFVWDDNTGVIPNEGEMSETGLSGIEIRLSQYSASGFPSGGYTSAFTDDRGFYTFPDGTVVSEFFQLEIVLPSGRTLVEKNASSSVSTLDSAADPQTGRTDEFNVANNCEQFTLHFGLK